MWDDKSATVSKLAGSNFRVISAFPPLALAARGQTGGDEPEPGPGRVEGQSATVADHH
jgi:hypothetical protein